MLTLLLVSVRQVLSSMSSFHHPGEEEDEDGEPLLKSAWMSIVVCVLLPSACTPNAMLSHHCRQPPATPSMSALLIHPCSVAVSQHMHACGHHA